MNDSRTTILRGWLACVATFSMPVAAWVAGQHAWAGLSRRGWHTLTADDAVLGLAALAAAVVALLVTADTVRTVAYVVTDRLHPSTPQPLVWRKVAVMATAFVLSGMSVGPAIAHDAATDPSFETVPDLTHEVAPLEHGSAVLVNPGWVPPDVPSEETVSVDAQVQPPGASAHVAASTVDTTDTVDERALAPTPEPHYTVVKGDSLWRITERALGPDASDGEIAQAWRSLYAANRDVIGSNPSLIHPGQVLVIPQEWAS